jgi:hypothetical protein
MKTVLVLLALLSLGLGIAETAAATCMYHEVLRVDPIKSDTGDPTLDSVVVSVGYAECHPPPPMDDPQ